MKTFKEFCSSNICTRGCPLSLLGLNDVSECEIAYGGFLIAQNKLKNCENCSEFRTYKHRQGCLHKEHTIEVCEHWKMRAKTTCQERNDTRKILHQQLGQ